MIENEKPRKVEWHCYGAHGKRSVSLKANTAWVESTTVFSIGKVEYAGNLW